MKTLLLMRHAKSSWEDLFCPDHDRPLSKRGFTAALHMGEWLAETDQIPDMVLLSSAQRVQDTWAKVSAGWHVKPKVMTVRNLYLTNAEHLLSYIRNTPKSVQSLLVINHEPTLGTLTASLATPPLATDCARALQKFATGAVARFELEGNWPVLSAKTARFTQFTKPKDLS